MRQFLTIIQWVITITGLVITLLFFSSVNIPTTWLVGAAIVPVFLIIGNLASLSPNWSPSRGGIVSIFLSFLLFILSVGGGIYLALHFSAPVWLIAIGCGIVLGGLAGAAASIYFKTSILYATFGAFFGLSADFFKAGHQPAELPKTIIGSVALFVDYFRAEITKIIPPPVAHSYFDGSAIPAFLWAAVLSAMATLFIGIFQRRNLQPGTARSQAVAHP